MCWYDGIAFFCIVKFNIIYRAMFPQLNDVLNLHNTVRVDIVVSSGFFVIRISFSTDTYYGSTLIQKLQSPAKTNKLHYILCFVSDTIPK
jgi:hypothetical protein